MELELNEPVPLNVQLADAESFVLATIFGPDNTPVVGSPVQLPYLQLNNYGTSSFLMPNLSWIKVIYQVFSDSAYSVPSTTYSNAVDIFTLGVSGGGSGGSGSTLTGEIVRYQVIVGEIEHGTL